MKDRTPKYPNRVVLTPVSGMANTYTLERRDEATQSGTALNKANLLDDATAQALGISNKTDGGTPNDAFKALNDNKAETKDYSRTYSTTTNPVANTGKNGDIWLNTTCGLSWIKINGAWQQIITRLPSIGKKSLNDCSWAEIAAIGKAGLAGMYFKIGDQKLIKNGSGTDQVYATLIDFEHDNVENPDAYGNSKASMTFCFKHSIQMSTGSSNIKYANTKARSTLDALSAYPDINNSLVKVMKTTAYDSDSASDSDTKTTAEKYWLMSASELGATPTDKIYGYSIEGTEYSYLHTLYSSGNFNTWCRSHPNDDAYKSASYRYFGLINVQSASTLVPISDSGSYTKQTTTLSSIVGFCI